MSRLFAVLVFLGVAVSAHAGGIVLESYTGERPADANRVLSPILDELATRGFSGGDTLARTYDAQVSRPAQTPTGLPADFAAQVDRGFKAWVDGRFDEAIKTLGPLVEAAHGNTGAFMRDQTLRQPLLKALIALALSQQRTGDPGATRATFTEILRAFPDTQLSRASYGNDAVELFEQVRREALASGKGKLTVKIADDSSVVFVDEAYRAVGSTSADLVPGEYRVCVMRDKQPTRSHRVVVHANSETTLAVDPALDQAVHTNGWTGLSFASEADRDAHEASYAASVARAIGASAVAVVGIEEVNGRQSIVGSLVSLETGREIRRASVALDPDPSTERLRALARFLAGDDPAAGLDVQLGAGASTTTATNAVPAPGGVHASAAPEGGRWGGYKWITGGLAVAALGTGVALVAIDGGCSMATMPGRPCNELYSTKTPGFVAIGGGAVLAGVSIWLFATGGGHPASHTAYVVPTDGGALAGYAGRF
jgi:hypothetical protein